MELRPVSRFFDNLIKRYLEPDLEEIQAQNSETGEEWCNYTFLKLFDGMTRYESIIEFCMAGIKQSKKWQNKHTSVTRDLPKVFDRITKVRQALKEH